MTDEQALGAQQGLHKMLRFSPPAFGRGRGWEILSPLEQTWSGETLVKPLHVWAAQARAEW